MIAISDIFDCYLKIANYVVKEPSQQVTMKKLQKFLLLVSSIVTLMTVSCQKPLPEKIPVDGVRLNVTSLILTEGEADHLTATVNPDNATNKNVSWTSSDNAVATVNNGKVTAVKAGTATITVKTEDGNKTATCTVTVKANTVKTEEDEGDLNYGSDGSAGDNIEDDDIYDGGSF